MGPDLCIYDLNGGEHQDRSAYQFMLGAYHTFKALIRGGHLPPLPEHIRTIREYRRDLLRFYRDNYVADRRIRRLLYHPDNGTSTCDDLFTTTNDGRRVEVGPNIL